MKHLIITVVDHEQPQDIFMRSTQIDDDDFTFEGIIDAAGTMIDDICETYELPEGKVEYELPE